MAYLVTHIIYIILNLVGIKFGVTTQDERLGRRLIRLPSHLSKVLTNLFRSRFPVFWTFTHVNGPDIFRTILSTRA